MVTGAQLLFNTHKWAEVYKADKVYNIKLVYMRFQQTSEVEWFMITKEKYYKTVTRSFELLFYENFHKYLSSLLSFFFQMISNFRRAVSCSIGIRTGYVNFPILLCLANNIHTILALRESTRH